MIPRLQWAWWLLLAVCAGYLTTAVFLWVRAGMVPRSWRRWARMLLLVATALGLASLGFLGHGARNCSNVASFQAIFVRAGDDDGHDLPVNSAIASSCRSGAVQNVSTALVLWLVIASLLFAALTLIRRRRRGATSRAEVISARR